MKETFFRLETSLLLSVKKETRSQLLLKLPLSRWSVAIEGMVLCVLLPFVASQRFFLQPRYPVDADLRMRGRLYVKAPAPLVSPTYGAATASGNPAPPHLAFPPRGHGPAGGTGLPPSCWMLVLGLAGVATGGEFRKRRGVVPPPA